MLKLQHNPSIVEQPTNVAPANAAPNMVFDPRSERGNRAMITGGCHCGAIRYQAEGEALTHALCHCTDCRRHAGAPMVGWTMYPQGAVKVTRGTPKVYMSSEHGRRHFCLIVAPDSSTRMRKCCRRSSIFRARPMTNLTPFRRERTFRSPNGSDGWSALTNCRCSSATRHGSNPVGRVAGELALASPLAGCFSYTRHDSDEGRPYYYDQVAVPTALAATALTRASITTPKSTDAMNCSSRRRRQQRVAASSPH